MGQFLRKQDWAERLNELISERMHTPFQWGANDCATFAADAVLAITGTDPSAEIRGTYSTAAGAAAALSAMGFASVADTPSGLLSDRAHLVPPKLAQRGDILEITNQDGAAMLAVCIGARCVTPGESGLVFNLTVNAKKAWRIQNKPI